MKTCCICGGQYEGFGNNPQPFDGEECCPECDDRFVIPVRMLLGRGYENRTILTLIQTIAELGTSIHHANTEVKKTFRVLPNLLRTNETTNGDGHTGEPPEAS